jgi:hypothetical protein
MDAHTLFCEKLLHYPKYGFATRTHIINDIWILTIQDFYVRFQFLTAARMKMTVFWAFTNPNTNFIKYILKITCAHLF